MLPEKTLFERPQGARETFLDVGAPVIGEKLRFTNVEQETPIGEFRHTTCIRARRRRGNVSSDTGCRRTAPD